MPSEIPVETGKKGDPYLSCKISLCDYFSLYQIYYTEIL